MDTRMTLVLVLVMVAGTVSVRINELRWTSPVILGNTTSVEMDCDYSLDKDDVEVVLKWYFNTDEQIFQWILPRGSSGQDPTALGRFANKVDWKYVVTSDPQYKHKALRLINLDYDLSGNYSCTLQSLGDEDRKEKSLLIYTPPSVISFSVTNQTPGTVNVTCQVEGVHPEPLIVLEKEAGRKKRVQLEDFDVRIVQRENKLYDIIVYKELQTKNLPSDIIFECLIAIPGTPFSKRKIHPYRPEQRVTGDDGDGAGRPHIVFWLPATLALMSSLFWRL